MSCWALTKCSSNNSTGNVPYYVGSDAEAVVHALGDASVFHAASSATDCGVGTDFVESEVTPNLPIWGDCVWGGKGIGPGPVTAKCTVLTYGGNAESCNCLGGGSEVWAWPLPGPTSFWDVAQV